ARGRAREAARKRLSGFRLRAGCPPAGADCLSRGLLSLAIPASRVQLTCQQDRSGPPARGPGRGRVESRYAGAPSSLYSQAPTTIATTFWTSVQMAIVTSILLAKRPILACATSENTSTKNQKARPARTAVPAPAPKRGRIAA